MRKKLEEWSMGFKNGPLSHEKGSEPSLNAWNMLRCWVLKAKVKSVIIQLQDHLGITLLQRPQSTANLVNDVSSLHNIQTSHKTKYIKRSASEIFPSNARACGLPIDVSMAA